MTTAYLNRIATTVPPHDVHDGFVRFARTRLSDNRRQSLFQRMVERAEIHHRWSCLAPATDPEGQSVDAEGFYTRGRFPGTAARMARYETEALSLAAHAVAGLNLGASAPSISHLIVTSCTGFFAPGIDLDLIWRCGLRASVERTTVGFMGCQAALNALKLARHIVRSDPSARVLVVSVELCTLHLQDTDDVQQLLSFLLFADGCAAAVVSAEPEGLALDRFYAVVEQETEALITWNIRDHGFQMFLSGQVPNAIGRVLRKQCPDILAGTPLEEVAHWAVHPGGRSVLDAVQTGLRIAPALLGPSRQVLADFGNMSSAGILFVLRSIMATAGPGETGCALAFGPGLSTETMLFRAVA